MATSYFNVIALHSVKRDSFAIVTLDPLVKPAGGNQDFDVSMNQSLSVSSMLQHSLGHEIEEEIRSGSKLSFQHHSRNSSLMDTSTPASGIPRVPSRSSPSPIVFAKSQNSVQPLIPHRSSPTALGIDANLGGNSSNQYSSDTLQNLLGLKRQSSRDQDRNFTHTRLSNGSGGAAPAALVLSHSRSVDEIDFSINSLMDGIYNDVLPFTEASVTFTLKWTESVAASVSESTQDKELHTMYIRFISDLYQV